MKIKSTLITNMNDNEIYVKNMLEKNIINFFPIKHVK